MCFMKIYIARAVSKYVPPLRRWWKEKPLKCLPSFTLDGLVSSAFTCEDKDDSENAAVPEEGARSSYSKIHWVDNYLLSHK